jgi:hypothetical protein
MMKTLGLEERYLLYERDCRAWEVPAVPLDQFKAYWQIFAKDGELQNGQSAPILVLER